MTLEDRIARLEAESDIRKLKARYLNACDRKDADAMRACFTEDAVIEFPPLGNFDLDGVVGIFTQMAVNTPIVDVHQGHNAEIEINGDEASATWNLGFATYDPREGTFRLLGSLYTDRYRKTEDGWKICFSRSEPRAIVDGKIEAGSIKGDWVVQG